MIEKGPFEKVIELKKTIREDPMCHVYSDKDIRRYVNCTMKVAEILTTEILKFDAHRRDCNACARKFIKIHEEAAAASQQEEKAFYFKKTMQYLDELDEKNSRKSK